MTNEAWVKRQTETDEDRREYEQERLVAWTSELLAELMAGTDTSKADLARILGCSRAHITQSLSGTRNLTLRSLADMSWALGHRASFSLEPLRTGEYISAPIRLVRSPRSQVVASSVEVGDLKRDPAEIEKLAG